MFRKGLLLIIRKYYTVRIYSNRYMLCVYVDWLLVGSITNLPTASIWVVALHRLFLYSDPPSLCHLPCDWLSLFSSQTFPLSIPQHSENHSFFISTPLWRWSDSVAKCMHIKFRPRGITQKKPYNTFRLLAVSHILSYIMDHNCFLLLSLHRDVF